jgi:hypothetical protein
VSVSLAGAAQKAWGKPEIVEVPEDEWRKKLEAYEAFKSKLSELPKKEVLATREELSRCFTI